MGRFQIDWVPAAWVLMMAAAALVAMKVMEALSVSWARRRTREGLKRVAGHR